MSPYERIDQAIDSASAGLRGISLDIHAHPELNFEEHHAHQLLTDYLDGEGFEVVRRAYTMPTAFPAVAGAGLRLPPHVGFGGLRGLCGRALAHARGTDL